MLDFSTKPDKIKQTDTTGKTAAESKDVFDSLKFIDDEEDQLSEAESFHSLGKQRSCDLDKN